MNDFDKWFKAQYGRLPMSPDRRKSLYDEWDDKRRAVAHLDEQLRKEDECARAYQFALYAWQVRAK